MGAMATNAPPPGAVVEVAPAAALVVEDVDAPPAALVEVEELDEFDGDELHAARPSAPAAGITSATVRSLKERSDMRREGSRSSGPWGSRVSG
jgi:hypothetical protein